MRRILLLLAACCFSPAAWGQKPPLLPEKDVAALANELSGETAKRNLEGLARFHRQRGSRGFHEAAELVAERLRAHGLSDVAVLQFPADGKIFYGTQRSRPAWDAEVGGLVELCQGKELQEVIDRAAPNLGVAVCFHGIASYEAEPVVLAEDSESADMTANLVDVGAGTKESDYTGKDVCASGRAARGCAGFGGWEIWSGGNCELRAEPEDGLVGWGWEFNSLGAPGDVFGE
jgi:aminopeptidase YwaD